LIAFILPFSAVPNVTGVLPLPHAASIVNIGDASWYYWPQPGSDTCVLWLGGGLESLQGGYLINPFEYESFGTIRFLQDLTRYYCVIALQAGSSPSNNYPNRTIPQEFFQGELTIAKQLHEWINDHGYVHIFLIGYSVGTEVAASIALMDPRTWSSSDGLILITANLPPDLVSEAKYLATNLLLLYGHAPAYEPNGERFFQLAPTLGLNGAALHKEYHLLDQMGHEVWSPLRNNTYNPIALGIVVNFIQTSIALQHGPVVLPPISLGPWNYSVINVEAPSQVMWGNPFVAIVTVTSSNQVGNGASVAAYDSISKRILTVTPLTKNQLISNVRLVIPTSGNASLMSFSVLVLEWAGTRWVAASNQYAFSLAATNHIQLQIKGLVPNSSITFDQTTFTVPNNGQAQFNTTMGSHNIVIQPEIEHGNSTYAFTKWSDGDQSTNKTINLDQDENLTTLYQTKYFVQITSPLSTVTGPGWRDANSTVEPSLQLGIVQSGYLFRNWISDSNAYGIGDPIPIRTPTTIQAVWDQYFTVPNPNPMTELWLLASLLICWLLLIMNLKLTRRQVDQRPLRG
jgi:pimeloyl-ACP methyl ester carboxylesterase